MIPRPLRSPDKREVGGWRPLDVPTTPTRPLTRDLPITSPPLPTVRERVNSTQAHNCEVLLPLGVATPGGILYLGYDAPPCAEAISRAIRSFSALVSLYRSVITSYE